MTTATGTVVKDAITTANVNLNGVLSEVVGLLPTVLPVMISFMAIRKGIGFLRGILRSA